MAITVIPTTEIEIAPQISGTYQPFHPYEQIAPGSWQVTGDPGDGVKGQMFVLPIDPRGAFSPVGERFQIRMELRMGIGFVDDWDEWEERPRLYTEAGFEIGLYAHKSGGSYWLQSGDYKFLSVSYNSVRDSEFPENIYASSEDGGWPSSVACGIGIDIAITQDDLNELISGFYDEIVIVATPLKRGPAGWSYTVANWGAFIPAGQSVAIGPVLYGKSSDFEDLSMIDLLNLGVMNAYTCSESLGVKSLALLLQTNDFITALKESIVGNPIENIIALNLIPVVANHGENFTPLTIGNQTHNIGYWYAVNNQWKTISLGDCEIPRVHNNYLDFEPYSSYELYLPWVGSVALNPSEIVGKSVKVRYIVDVLSCMFIAYVSTDDGETQTTIGSFTGSCGYQIPLTASDRSQQARSMLEGAATAVASVVGVAIPPLATVSAVAGTAGLAKIGQAALSPAQIQRTGSLAGAAGYMGASAKYTPYIIRHTPIDYTSSSQNAITGTACMKIHIVNELTGYTEFESIDLDGITATSEELDEIENIMKTGVYL